LGLGNSKIGGVDTGRARASRDVRAGTAGYMVLVRPHGQTRPQHRTFGRPLGPASSARRFMAGQLRHGGTGRVERRHPRTTTTHAGGRLRSPRARARKRHRTGRKPEWAGPLGRTARNEPGAGEPRPRVQCAPVCVSRGPQSRGRTACPPRGRHNGRPAGPSAAAGSVGTGRFLGRVRPAKSSVGGRAADPAIRDRPRALRPSRENESVEPPPGGEQPSTAGARPCRKRDRAVVGAHMTGNTQSLLPGRAGRLVKPIAGPGSSTAGCFRRIHRRPADGYVSVTGAGYIENRLGTRDAIARLGFPTRPAGPGSGSGSGSIVGGQNSVRCPNRRPEKFFLGPLPPESAHQNKNPPVRAGTDAATGARVPTRYRLPVLARLPAPAIHQRPGRKMSQAKPEQGGVGQTGSGPVRRSVGWRTATVRCPIVGVSFVGPVRQTGIPARPVSSSTSGVGAAAGLCSRYSTCTTTMDRRAGDNLIADTAERRPASEAGDLAEETPAAERAPGGCGPCRWRGPNRPVLATAGRSTSRTERTAATSTRQPGPRTRRRGAGGGVGGGGPPRETPDIRDDRRRAGARRGSPGVRFSIRVVRPPRRRGSPGPVPDLLGATAPTPGRGRAPPVSRQTGLTSILRERRVRAGRRGRHRASASPW